MIDRRVLKEFADAVKQHHGDAFGIFAEIESAEGGQAHQRKLIEHISRFQFPAGFQQNRIGRRQIGGDVQRDAQIRTQVDLIDRVDDDQTQGQQRRGDQQPVIFPDPAFFLRTG